MHKTFDKDHACGSGDMLADRQTHTERQTHRRAHYNTSPNKTRSLFSVTVYSRWSLLIYPSTLV